MQMTMSYFDRLGVVVLLIVGLTLAPVLPSIALAAEGAAAAGTEALQKPASGSGGAAAGVGVSGSPQKAAPAGKGVLAPPEEVKVPTKTPSVKSVKKKEIPKGIGASAGTAGTAGTQSGGGVSMGWKIGGAVLGLGLLLGLAGGGGSSGGGTNSNH